jgi:tRNA A-37 threonylcarbamoyl transferase component Bud32
VSDRKLRFVLTDRSGSQVLVLSSGGGWTLPAYVDAVPSNVGFTDPRPWNVWFANTYGIHVVRRYALDQQGLDAAYFILESLEEEPGIPERARWVSADDLETIHLAEPGQRAFLASWFAHPQRSVSMPWSAPGGFEQPLSWMYEQLKRHGRKPCGTPEQVKNAYVSTVMRCPTDAGDVYFKILPSIFVREASVLEKLRAWGMLDLPVYLAVDSERGLVLMEDLGGRDLAECCTTALLKRAVREYADLQVASTSRLTPGRPWPFYDWRMMVLAKKVEHVVHQARKLLAGSPYELTESEEEQLRGCLPNWVDLCHRIVETHIPDALDHGDLRPGNIRIVGEQIVFYDWAWSAITHPFLSITSLLYILRNSVVRAEGTKEMLRDVYLETWMAYASLDKLRRAFELVDRARILYYVVADATWLECLWGALADKPLSPTSADACTLRWRQYYYAKVLRRLFESGN